MVQAISIQGKTYINSQTLIRRDYAAVTNPPIFNCSYGGEIITTVGPVTGFQSTFLTSYYRIQYAVGFNSTAQTAPFSKTVTYRILAGRFDANTPVTSVYVNASVAGSPSSIANIRIWFSYSDYVNNNSPNLTQIINSNPLTGYCFVPALDGSAITIDLQSVAAPGTSYPYGHLTGSIDAGELAVAISGFTLVNGTEKAYSSSGAESSATTCNGVGSVGFGYWQASCLTSSKNWIIGSDGRQLIVVDKNGTESLGTNTSPEFWTFLGYLPSGITWGSITGGAKSGGGYTSLVIADLVSNTTTYAYATTGGYYWASGTLPIVGITATYVLDTFVITPSGSVLAYSYDGINWSTTNLSSSENWISCFYCSDNFFYLISASGKVIRASTINGSWTTVATTGKTFSKVVYGKYNGTDTFVAKISSTSISYSTNRGQTWTDVNLSSSYSNVSILDIAYGDTYLTTLSYFVITNASPAANQIFWSVDGINWNVSYSNINSLASPFSIANAPFGIV